MVEIFVGMITWSRRRKPFLASTLLPTELCWISSQTATNRWRSDRSKKKSSQINSTFRSSFYGLRSHHLSPSLPSSPFLVLHVLHAIPVFWSGGRVLGRCLRRHSRGVQSFLSQKEPFQYFCIILRDESDESWKKTENLSNQLITFFWNDVHIWFFATLGPFAWMPRHVRFLQGSAAWPNRLWPSGQRRRGAVDVDKAFGSQT